MLANRRLTPAQRQLLLAGKFRALRDTDRLPEALAMLRQIVALDPDTDTGRGSSSFLKFYTEPVRLAGRTWTTADNRPVWLPMIADVSDVVKAPGAYEIEFRHKSGSTRFAKTVLSSGDRTLASDDNANETRPVRLVVTEKPAGPVRLSVESRGTGGFDGAGEIVVRKVD